MHDVAEPRHCNYTLFERETPTPRHKSSKATIRKTNANRQY